jgi:hypothetical protein
MHTFIEHIITECTTTFREILGVLEEMLHHSGNSKTATLAIHTVAAISDFFTAVDEGDIYLYWDLVYPKMAHQSCRGKSSGILILTVGCCLTTIFTNTELAAYLMAASSLSKNPLVYEYFKIFASVIPELDETSFGASNYQKRFGSLEEEHQKAIARLATAKVLLTPLNFVVKLIRKGIVDSTAGVGLGTEF